MTDVKMLKAVQAAEVEVQAVLKRLESETDGLITDIEVCSIDATSMGDPGPRYMRKVRITMGPRPGADWI